MIMSYSGKAGVGWEVLGGLPTEQLSWENHLYLNLKEEPRVKRMGLGLGLGSS